MSLSAIAQSMSTQSMSTPSMSSPFMKIISSLWRRFSVRQFSGRGFQAGRLLLMLALMIGLTDQIPAFAQQPVAAAAVDPAAAGGLDAEALKVLVAPVALYPDDVLAVVLPASTTGLQIVQAQRYLDQHKTNAALQPNADWDPSILALLNYPDVLARLNADLDWAQRLGDAVINQQADVMEAIQQIRNEAVASGYLKTDANTVVTQQQQTVIFHPANPQVIYVPNYDPQVIVQQTYVSAPPPVYYNPYPPYYSPAATFFTGMAVGGALAYAFDWGHHDIDVHYHDDDHHGGNNNNNNYNINNNFNHNEFTKNNIDRKPGQAGDKYTWNGKDKRPATKPATRPAGLAPTNHPASLPGKLGNQGKVNTPPIKPKAGQLNNSQVKNRVGNSQATGKTPGGFGNITPSRQTQLQSQRGTQSLQQHKAPQAKAKPAAPAQFNKGAGAFSGSSAGGANIKAQQQRGGGSRGRR
jgi:hypothetical protein